MVDPVDEGPLSGSPDASPERARQHEARRVAAALDVLVRTSKADPRNAERLAFRALDALRALGAPLRLGPRHVRYDGAVVLTASGAEAAWCLPAHMAGLRSIAVRPDATPEALLAFAERLAALRVDRSSIDAFQDTLWVGGFEGLALDVTASVLTVAATLELVDAANEVAPPARAWAPFADRPLEARVPEVDRGAPESDCDALVEPLRRALRTRSLEPDAADRASAGFALGDPRSWARAAFELPLKVQDGRTFVPLSWSAKQACVWLEGPLYADDVARCKTLLASADPYVRDVLDRVGWSRVGRAIGTFSVLDEETTPAVVELLGAATAEPVRRALALALVERASRDAAASALVGRFSASRNRAGFSGLVLAGAEDLARAGALTVDAARATKRLLDAANEGAASLSRWARVAPPELLATDACAQLFEAPGMEGARLLVDVDGARREALLPHASSSDAGVDALARAIAETHGELFSGKPLAKALVALLRTPEGASALVALTADRKASDTVRIAALDVAATRDDLAEAVLGSKLRNLLDSDAVREHRAALKRARKTLGLA